MIDTERANFTSCPSVMEGQIVVIKDQKVIFAGDKFDIPDKTKDWGGTLILMSEADYDSFTAFVKAKRS